MSTNVRRAALAVLIAMFSLEGAFAQNIVTNGASAGTAPAARQSLKFGADYQLASWMAADFDVAQSLAEVAQQRGSNATREFAKRSSAVRAKWIESLKPFLGNDAQGVSLAATAEPQSTSAANSVTAASSTSSAPIVSTVKGPAFDLVSLKQAIAAETLAATHDEWSKLSESEFDRAYGEWEARTGRCAVETLSVFREHASPALRQVVDGVLPELKSRALDAASGVKK